MKALLRAILRPVLTKNKGKKATRFFPPVSRNTPGKAVARSLTAPM